MKGGTEMIEQIKGSARVFLIITALLSLLSITTPTGDLAQDASFRLSNIERRLDQVQQRVDFIERALQNQSFNRASDSNAATAAVLEMQRKQLSLAEQVLLLDRRILEMQKTIDRMREANQATKEVKEAKETKETPKGETKPKPPQGKQQ
jgi:hypothetical protein